MRPLYDNQQLGIMSDVLLGTDVYPQRLLKSRQLMVYIVDWMQELQHIMNGPDTNLHVPDS